MKMNKIRVGLLGLALLLASCGPAAPTEPVQTQADPQAVFTAAAQTAQARMTEMAAITPTQAPTETPTLTAEPSFTATITPTQPPAQTGIDLIEFVFDVTIPDGTNFSPGATFVKTWRLKNIGSTTWNTAYSLVFVSGAQMNGAPSTPLPGDVSPGSTVDLSVNLVAPDQNGAQVGYWMLRNPNQKNFGLGPNADGAFYVAINVTGGVTADTATPTSGTPTTGTPAAGTPTVTPTTSSSGSVVSDVTLGVDNSTFAGSCPHTFNFTASFTLNQAATVTYQMEAETGFSIELPAPTTVSLGAGTHTLNYALEFSGSLTGTARFHVSAPENVLSNTVNLSLTCN